MYSKYKVRNTTGRNLMSILKKLNLSWSAGWLLLAIIAVATKIFYIVYHLYKNRNVL